MKKLVIALATRGRPNALIETLARTLPNITEPETQLLVMLDSDDAVTFKALEGKFSEHADRLIINVHEREDTVAEKFNRALKWDADVYSDMVDHTHFVTRGFDRRILEAAARFPDGIGFVFNHMANASFVGNYSWTRRVADIMGYLFPPYFPYWFIDHWVDDIARMVDRISFADVATDSSRKLMPTQEMRECNWWATWYDAAVVLRRRVAQKIVESPDFQEAPWRKGIFSHGGHPLVEWYEARSRWVNDFVRQQNYPSLPTADARYQRVKQKATAMIPSMLEGMDPRMAAQYRNALLPQDTVISLKRAYA